IVQTNEPENNGAGDFHYGANAASDAPTAPPPAGDGAPLCSSGQKSPAAPDPFDVARLRLPEDADADFGVKELLVAVPYRKPSKESFIRVDPSPDYRAVGGLIGLKEDDTESFWVDRDLWPLLADEPTFGRRQIFTCVTRAGLVFLWGCRLPGPDGK